MKPYVFNGTTFNDLDSLAKAYIDDFDKGVNDIYQNSKLLVKFVKGVTKNKELVKEVVSILAYSKFKNNALTFIIYTFLEDKKVYINGKLFTFKTFVEELKAYPEITNNNALYAFMEDYGISKTFAKEEENSKIAVDAFFIEKNYKDVFTYRYLTTLDVYGVDEAPYAKLSTIAVNGEECFRRATKVAFNEDFQLGLAHKLGFKAAVEMHNEVNPLFKAIKLLREKREVEDDQLKKLITDTFYWWLLDNLDKYLAIKKEARNPFIRLLELKKEYQSYKDKILRKEITDISLDLLADISRGIYLNYLNFVTLFRDGKIIVKKRFNEQQYSFDKPYCRTYITADFMKDHIVKLYNPNKDEQKVISINPLTGAEIENDEAPKEIDVDDISEDKPVLVHIDDENLLSDIKVAKKVLSRNSALAKYSIATAILNTILVIGLAVAAMCTKTLDLGEFSQVIQKVDSVAIILIVIAAIAFVLTLGFAITLNILSKKTYNDANTLLFITNAKTKEKVSPKQESRLINLLLHENDYKYSIKRRYKILRLVAAVFQAVTFALIFTIGAIVLSHFVSNIFKMKPQALSITLAAFAGPLVGSLVVLFKKKNGVLSMLLIDLLAIAGVILIAILGV